MLWWTKVCGRTVEALHPIQGAPPRGTLGMVGGGLAPPMLPQTSSRTFNAKTISECGTRNQGENKEGVCDVGTLCCCRDPRAPPENGGVFLWKVWGSGGGVERGAQGRGRGALKKGLLSSDC